MLSGGERHQHVVPEIRALDRNTGKVKCVRACECFIHHHCHHHLIFQSTNNKDQKVSSILDVVIHVVIEGVAYCVDFSGSRSNNGTNLFHENHLLLGSIEHFRSRIYSRSSAIQVCIYPFTVAQVSEWHPKCCQNTRGID